MRAFISIETITEMCARSYVRTFVYNENRIAHDTIVVIFDAKSGKLH